MLAQALTITFKTLAFKAGPQDFPHDATPMLSRICIGFGVVANTLLFGLSIPLPAALLMGVISVAALALFVRTVLRLRQLDTRFAQTLNSLLACGSVLLLLISLPVAELLPAMTKFIAALQADPTLASRPEARPELAVGPSLFLDVLTLWFLAVTGHIFRQATGTGFLAAALITLLCVLNVLLVIVFMAPLAALLVN